MSRSEAPTVFDRCRAELDELLLGGRADMAVIQHAIDALPLDGDARDALWLWAQGRRERRLTDARHGALVGREALGDRSPAIIEGA
jgi:hypothetical protein